ncbi:TatD family hydrolase [Meiothermus hypogaeus]|uniref:TatD family hydrolase n=2 Tax=Meiothermus hypogaeus TaxID=884155 RepID=A0A511R3Z2_9DEIN|nr:TatD family hydrolase [Meiothermus hypogaeus]RIH79342.1 putative metal-dependent hydrolase YcfH [Meiothermus hypogaeus]GEM84324.1 TatD family hydrolase [Meiothermus hypogaeus NBRC 106114]
MTDTHCHLDYMQPEETQAAIEASRDFKAILTIGTNPVRNRKALALAEGHPHIWAAVGLHPTEAMLLSPELEADLLHLAQHPKVRAIGETGLDFYWTPETRLAQYKALEFQHQLAQTLRLPLIFHVRSKEGSQAEIEIASWLLQNKPSRFVLHAFGGHPRLLEVGLLLGAYFGFAGPLTYKKNVGLREAAMQIPLNRLLVETDAPFLPPEPHRGKRNHPALVRFTLARLAELRQLEVEEMERVTDQNAQACFGF